MTNRLKDATSPYLIQHAENPVDWREWDEEALKEARELDRPIFLSIGYAACHWCHVMAHESFEDPDVAAIMNEHFVNIKVDREERPDIDALYMDAVVAMTGHGGWPMSVFLTPEGKPFFGGTYYPPVRRHNLPSFRDVLLGVSRAWREERDRLLASGSQLTEHISAPTPLAADGKALDPATLERAAERMFRAYDWSQGGWGGAPKFPQASSIEFLLRKYHRGSDVLARDMAAHALDSMAAGGIFDQVGGGFHRYAVDGKWRVPHFEKMLYDNALLARTYVHGWQVTGRTKHRRIAEATLDFMLREMRHPDGGLYSSLDADSEGEEGKFYVWTLQEVQAVLHADTAELVAEAFGLTSGGNFEGSNVLYQAVELEALADDRQAEVDEVQSRLAGALATLLDERARRVRPATDDKVLTSWNGLALSAFATAARAFGRADYLQAAQEIATFLLDHLVTEEALMRTWRQGTARYAGFLEDHAAFGEGLLSLYDTDFDSRWYEAAVDRAEAVLRDFQDPAGGFFDTALGIEQLIARPKSLQDSPTPSGNAMAISLLLRLAALTGEMRYSEPAERALAGMQASAAQHPTAFAAWLSAIDFALGPQLQLAIVGDPESQAFRSLAEVAHRQYLPRLVSAGGEPGTEPSPALVHGRDLIESQATAYLCQHFACQLPTTSAEALADQIESAL